MKSTHKQVAVDRKTMEGWVTGIRIAVSRLGDERGPDKEVNGSLGRLLNIKDAIEFEAQRPASVRICSRCNNTGVLHAQHSDGYVEDDGFCSCRKGKQAEAREEKRLARRFGQ